jgi:UDP-glucose 4-epimerase
VLTFTGGPSKTKFMAERKTKAQRPLRLALTGAHTFLGRRLIERMEADPNCSHILVLDIEPSDVSGAKSRFVRLDLTHPLADGRAAQALVEDEIDVLCHLAFLAIPSHSSSWAHELEAIGSLYVMNAAAEAKVKKVILSSTTMVYGAYPDNPNFLTE